MNATLQYLHKERIKYESLGDTMKKNGKVRESEKEIQLGQE